MKKVMMALSLCLMSVICFANNRQVTGQLPSNTPSVTLTIDGKTHVVQPTKAVVKEIDEKHVKCIVYANKDKAEVTLPIGYDTMMKLGSGVAKLCQTMGIVSDQQYNEMMRWLEQQIGQQ